MADYGDLAPQTSPYGQTFFAPSGLLAPPIDPSAPTGAPMPSSPADQGWQPPTGYADLWSQAAGVPLGSPTGAPAAGAIAPPLQSPAQPSAGVTPQTAAALATNSPSGPAAIPLQPSPAMGAALAKINGAPAAAATSTSLAGAVPPLPSLAQTSALAQDAIKDQSKANELQTQAQVDAANAEQAARVQGSAEQDRLVAQQQADQAERLRQRAIVDAHVQQLQKEADDYRIDPNKDFSGSAKVGSLIAMALSGIGNSIAGRGDQPNPVLQMIQQHIKDSVDRQMDQRAQLQKKADRGVTALDRFDQFSKDRDAQSLAMQGQALQRTARQVELAAGQYVAPQARANGMKTAADLKALSAQKFQEAGDKAFDQKIKQQEQDTARAHVGVAYAGLAETKRHALVEEKHSEDVLAYQKQKDADDNATKLLEHQLTGKGGAAAQQLAAEKDVRETGIHDPTTGAYLQTPEAKAYADKATAYATQAATTTDPKAKQALLDQAQQYKDASTQAIAKAADKEDRPKIEEKMAGAQQMVDAVGEMKRLINRDPSGSDRDAWQRIGTMWNQAKITYGKSEGGRLNDKEQELLDKVFGPDPGDLTTREFSKEKLLTALDTVQNDTTSQTSTYLKGKGIHWMPRTLAVDEKGLAPIDELQQEKTPLERAAGTERGAAGKIISGDLIPGPGGNTAEDNRKQRAENTGTPSGLSTTQQQVLDGMIARARKNGPTSDDYQQLVLAATDQSRPTLASGVLSTLRGDAPDIYADAVKQLPSEQQQLATTAGKLAAHVTAEHAPISALARGAIHGDQESIDEISRRAIAGDRDAQVAIAHIAALHRGQ
jgi:hypothetical protein